jgi:signal transduction histidine kinase
MVEDNPIEVVCVGEDAQLRQLTISSLALLLPGVKAKDAPSGSWADMETGSVAIVCEGTLKQALATVQRASRYAGSIVVVGDDESPDESARLDYTRISRNSVSEVIGDIVVQCARLHDDHQARVELRETRRLIAAGQIALGLQHSINNPLTALLAEAQLLELDDLSPEHREAVERIITQCRRVADIVRRLDGVSQRSA